jgi:hypothetical protein
MATQLPAAGAADQGIFSLFTQSCTILGDEMRSLRSEVGRLRDELGSIQRGSNSEQHERRIRALEQQSSLPRKQSGGGHPLQHLISGDDEEDFGGMDVDGVGGNVGGNNRPGSLDAPLPPRSRGKQFKITG